MKVIVTGASKGIGRGIAAVLASEGYELGLLARSYNLLEEFQNQHADKKIHIAQCDLRNFDDTQDAIASLIDKMNGIDALINNAGMVLRKNVMEISLDEWHAQIETNINGVFYTTRSTLPAMIEQKHGHIINISSISGKVPLPGGSGYAASKYAVTGFSQSLFQEVREHNIKVTTLFPGSVDSASHRHEASADHSWKVSPQDVGHSCHHILQSAPQTCISELEIRPLHKAPKK
ncbi:SDR family NAD(P)-dependent oxidoreductase [bacterium]|nr:SDR family NAD(P)-dependent oxidoreductase [bacterium]